MSSLFQGLTDANGVVKTRVAATAPAGSSIFRGILLDSAGAVVITEDTGQTGRNSVGGVATLGKDGIVLVNGAQEPYTWTSGGIRTDRNGGLSVQSGTSGDVIHQGVALTAAGGVICSNVTGKSNIWNSTNLTGASGSILAPDGVTITQTLAINQPAIRWIGPNVGGVTFRLRFTSAGTTGHWRIVSRDPYDLTVGNTDMVVGLHVDITFTVPADREYWDLAAGTAELTPGPLINCYLTQL